MRAIPPSARLASPASIPSDLPSLPVVILELEELRHFLALRVLKYTNVFHVTFSIRRSRCSKPTQGTARGASAFDAGKEAAAQAVEGLDAPKVAFVYCSCDYNVTAVVDGVKEAIPAYRFWATPPSPASSSPMAVTWAVTSRSWA